MVGIYSFGGDVKTQGQEGQRHHPEKLGIRFCFRYRERRVIGHRGDDRTLLMNECSVSHRQPGNSKSQNKDQSRE